jgi:hypothetical protein
MDVVVAEAEAAVVEEQVQENETSPEIKKSKSKHLNKLLYNKIREQMEFYFSDSNLSKDRFIKQEIIKSPDDGCKHYNLYYLLNHLNILFFI